MTEKQKEIILQLCECNMSPTAVARNMNYHRGTIIYHMEKIKEQTGLDPMVFNDLVKLKEMAERKGNLYMKNLETGETIAIGKIDAIKISKS